MDFSNEQHALMKMSLFLAITVLMLFIFSAPTLSQLYHWKDEKGIIHIFDSPPQRISAKEIKIKEKKETPETEDLETPEDPRKLQNDQMKEKRSYQEIEVTMYMTDWCPYCRKAREYLNSLGVNLTEYNVDRDREMAEESRRKGGRGVPVIDVEGIIITGHSPERIKEAVEKRRNL